MEIKSNVLYAPNGQTEEVSHSQGNQHGYYTWNLQELKRCWWRLYLFTHKPTTERMPSQLMWLLPGMLFILDKKGWEGHKLPKVMKRTSNWPFKTKTSARLYILLSMLIAKIYLGGTQAMEQPIYLVKLISRKGWWSDVKTPTEIPKGKLQKRSILHVHMKHLFCHQYLGFSY